MVGPGLACSHPADILSFLSSKDGGCTCPGDVAKAFGKYQGEPCHMGREADREGGALGSLEEPDGEGNPRGASELIRSFLCLISLLSSTFLAQFGLGL